MNLPYTSSVLLPRINSASGSRTASLGVVTGLLALALIGCGDRSKQAANDPGVAPHHEQTTATLTDRRTVAVPAVPGSTTVNQAQLPTARVTERPAPKRDIAVVEVIPTVESLADARGQVSRERLLRGNGKYPLIRVEETIVRGPAGEQVVTRREMVGDHIMVSAAPGKSAADVAAMAERLGMSVRRHLPGSSTYLLAFTAESHAALPDARMKLAKEAVVRTAEPDWIVTTYGDPVIPNDPLFSQLWGMNNAGQTGGLPDADIDAPEAWGFGTGSLAVRVGVIDTGIDYNHPELQANIWTNPGESGGDANGGDKRTNGIDDDGNGYVDDWHGWDFVNNDNDPIDDHSHGTHCSGTIGGRGNDGSGVAGVCWQVSLIGLKFLSSGGSGAISDAVEAQLYANQMQFDLTSNSWGGGGYSQAMKDAIDAAGNQGHLFVAAAGNSSQDNDVALNYPSSYDSPNVIAVAATDHADTLAYFSSYGLSTVDLGAPGVNIVSSVAGGGYASYNGTSMATPHVAGACALLKSVNPSLSGMAIKQALLATVDQVSALQGKTVTGGRLNVGRAVLLHSGPTLEASVITTTDGPDADTVIEPGELVTIAVDVTNTGSTTAGGVNGILLSNDPLVSVLQGQVFYGNVAPGSHVAPSQLLYVGVSPSIATPHPVTLNLLVSGTEPDGDPRTWTIPITFTISNITPISGQVKRATGGAPVGSALVTYSGPAAGSVQANAQGYFSFAGVEGAYTLIAEAAGFNQSEPVLVTTPPPASNVELFLGHAQIQVNPSAISMMIPQGSGTGVPISITNTGDARLNTHATAPSGGSLSPNGFWHLSNYQPHTGANAWYYGIEPQRNYDNGARNSGSLESSPVVVTGNGLLTWWSRRQTETGTYYDQSLVQILPAGASTWITVAQMTDTSATWQSMGVDLSSYVGQSLQIRFFFDTMDGIANQAEGWYVDDIAVGGVEFGLDGWLRVESPDNSLLPGNMGSTIAYIDTAGLNAGTHQSQVTITSNDLQHPVTTVPVTIEVYPLAYLYQDGITTQDSLPPSDGDGVLEPGESGTVWVALRNDGYGPATNCTGAMSTNDPYITILSNNAVYGTIVPGGRSQGTGITVQVAPNCPPDHQVMFTYLASAEELAAGSSGSFFIRSRSRVQGVITDALSGAGMENVTVSVSSMSTQTGSDGSYLLADVPQGTWTVTAEKSGYTSRSSTVTLPPNAQWNVALGSPEIAVTPTELVQTLPIGGSVTRPLTIDNLGAEPLQWSIVQSASGYTYKTSDQSGGPAFVWNDIAATGTPFVGLGDDNTIGPFPIGFAFPWYGGTMNQFYQSSNGYLSFTSPLTYLWITGLPNLNAPPDLVAIFLRDWNFNSGGSACYQLVDAGTLVIQYTDVPAYGNSSNRITCQTVLKSDGTITFYYLGIGIAASGTVGIQDGTRTVGTQISQNQEIVHAQFAVRLTPESGSLSVAPTSGTVAPGSSAVVMVTIDGSLLPLGTTTDELVIQSNDADEAALVVPVITTMVVNQSPVAQPQALIAWMDQATAVTLNGTDPDGDPLTYQVVSGPTAGTLTGTPPTLIYHPGYGVTGADTFTFTVSDGTAISEPATVTMNVAAYDLKVNFQPTAAPTPPGYMQDYGRASGGGDDFGWNLPSVIQTRDRNSTLSPDQRYDTLIHMQKPENPNASWEVPVPNGTYQITVVCGDASNFDSVFRLQIENVLAVSGTPTSVNRWVSSTPGLKVRVTDGRLTMSNGAGAVNNKVCFITALQVPTALFSARVNFQPANVAVPSGWVADTGAVYGQRNGLTYGWTIDNSANVRVRNAANSPSVLFDTFNHMQKSGNTDAIWEIAVPNGTYEVIITSGDPSNIDSVFRLNAEGILAVSGTPTAANRWFTSVPGLRVTVTDGKLTVRNGAGASNNKINLIEIMQVPQAGG